MAVGSLQSNRSAPAGRHPVQLPTTNCQLPTAMLAKLRTFALAGIDAVPVEVEVDAAAGTPKTVLVGLPELAVRESIHRIERALANLGYFRPTGRTIINLAPADLRHTRFVRRRLGRALP